MVTETATDWTAEARKRADAASPGPWDGKPYWPHDQDAVVADVAGRPVFTDEAGDVVGAASLADALFVAAARTDLPRALDALDRVRALCQAHMFGTAQAAMWPRDVLAAIAGN